MFDLSFLLINIAAGETEEFQGLKRKKNIQFSDLKVSPSEV